MEKNFATPSLRILPLRALSPVEGTLQDLPGEYYLDYSGHLKPKKKQPSGSGDWPFCVTTGTRAIRVDCRQFEFT